MISFVLYQPTKHLNRANDFLPNRKTKSYPNWCKSSITSAGLKLITLTTTTTAATRQQQQQKKTEEEIPSINQNHS